MSGIANSNRRVIVIDDNPSIHDDFRKILVPDDGGSALDEMEASFFGEVTDSRPRLDIELDTADQGREGFEKVKAAVASGNPYAVAFVDMRMPPGWDGLTTIEHLWEADPNLQVVICSAYSDKSWADICRRLGSTDRLLILKKPFDNAEVCQLALALTEKWNLKRQAAMRRDELEKLVDERTEKLKQMDEALRQKQKLEAIGSLAGGVAHEFNNLLQAISGYTRFAMDQLAESDQAYDDLTHVIEAADRAAGITGQLLSFSRRNPPKKALLKANKIVDMTLNMARPLLGANVDVDTVLGGDVGCVSADAELLSQALLNLCINARDAMSESGTLTIQTSRQTLESGQPRDARIANLADGDYALISVTDTGSGISEEVQERIFEPFFTTKEVGKGTGMGLAMVFGAIHDHGGMVLCDSEVGKGSTFSILVPIVADEEEMPTHSTNHSDGCAAKGVEKVLLAEDDETVRDVSLRTLRQAGYEVIVATDGQEAFDAIEEHGDSLQLAILDVVMPKFSGHEVFQRLREKQPGIEVVFCTGYDPEAMKLNTPELEGTIVVRKPVDRDELLKMVRRVLDQAKSTAAPAAVGADDSALLDIDALIN